MRGYLAGGTTEGSRPAPLGELASTNSGEVAQLLRQLAREQQNEKIATWARELGVVNSLHDFDRDYMAFKKVGNNGLQQLSRYQWKKVNRG